ncbi:MAG: sugar ABC transporter ATP-binding protein [Spirochaetales bacterium]|nr:sugar ABC transporter ATP-binding protein [Spirochaetales bacterium]
MADDKLIEAKAVSKAFAGVSALTEVDFQLRAGEVHALMGENGAGKSTLSKIFAGVLLADAGAVYLEGRQVRFLNTKEAAAQGVTIVSQEFSLIPDFPVAENIFLVDEAYYKKGFISNKNAMVRETYSLLKLFDMETYIDPYEHVRQLSVAQMQIVEILKAISKKARVIILDEPTAALSANEIRLLFDLVRRLKAENVGFIIVSHKINEIYEVSDRITVLRDGRLVLGGVKTTELAQTDLIKAMVGREVNNIYGVKAQTAQKFHDKKVIFEAVNICDRRGYVNNICFQVHEGEIVGISGLVGAGRTELVRCLFGADKCSKGEVIVNSKPIKANTIRKSMKNGMGFVPEDRKFDGLFQELSVSFNIAITDLIIHTFMFVNRKSQDRKCMQKAEELGIRLNNPETPVKSLSGGNQQKVLLAKWLLLEPRVLIVDEPTRGVDVGAKAEIYAILRQLAARGVAIIIVSSEIPEILGLCNQILVMREGRITGRLDAAQAQEELIGYYATIG